MAKRRAVSVWAIVGCINGVAGLGRNFDAKGGRDPSPRRGHCATAYINSAGAHFVYVFGGSTSSGCVNSEVYALDVKACRWRKANPEGGFMPQPRSGAASARLGDTWYVVGGGNSEGGCVDTVALTLRDPLFSGTGVGGDV